MRTELQKGKIKKTVKEARMPTQEERLAEAVITEKENIKSLGKFGLYVYNRELNAVIKSN